MPSAPFTPWLIAIAAAYLLGGVPFGYLIGKARGVDIRQHGSKNIGATNTWRVLGRTCGILCFVLDLLKGALPVLVSGAVMGVLGDRVLDQRTSWLWLGVAIASVLGHMYSPYLGFKGGKGVATGFGAMVALWPHITLSALIALVLWLITLKVSKMISVSSCLAALSMPLSLALLRLAGWPAEGFADAAPFLIVTGTLAALVIIRHRSNLSRVFRGTENKVGRASQSQPDAR